MSAESLRTANIYPVLARWFRCLGQLHRAGTDLSMHTSQELAVAGLVGQSPLGFACRGSSLIRFVFRSCANFGAWQAFGRDSEVETKVLMGDNSLYGALLRTLVSRCPTLGSLPPGLGVSEMSETW